MQLLYLWCPSSAVQDKLAGLLREAGAEFEFAVGHCVVLRLTGDSIGALVLPLRRGLSQSEADDIKALHKSDSGPLTTEDFPRVQSFARFATTSDVAWIEAMVRDNRLTSVLQPIAHASRPRKVFAYEALLRGAGSEAGIVDPTHLFEVARGCGMVVQLDMAARKAAIDRMLIDGVAETLFINLTPSAIEDPGASLQGTVSMIDEAGIAHDRIVFEVVESERANSAGGLSEILRRYRDAGFRVALDDVGAGYSSLNLLHQLRPDFVKLDMALIRGVHLDPYKALIAQKIIEIANSLDIDTIAEGIETRDELAWAGANGATYVQGYAVGRPSTPVFDSPAFGQPWRVPAPA